MRLTREPSEHRAQGARLAKRMLVMLIAVGLVFGAVFGFLWYRSRAISEFLAASREPPAAVAAATASAEPWRPRVDAVGSLRAVRGVEVSTEIAGVVQSINFTSGDTVNAGDVLVQLNADADIAQLEAARVAAELAQTALRRAREEFAVQAISRAALDAAAAESRSRRAQVREREALLARKTIRAPFAGRLGISSINPGQFLNPGDPIVTLQALDPIYADFALPQQQLARIAVGQPVTVTTNVYPQRGYPGRISAVAPRVDPATRNLQVQATLANPGQELLPGMFASVSITIGEEEPRITLPQTAISYNPYGSIVFVLEPTADRDPQGRPIYTARQRFVEAGERRGDRVAIVSGVETGELIVTAGQLKLRNGSPAVLSGESASPLGAAGQEREPAAARE